MARKFNFVISADNNPALKAIRSVNRELYRINKPFRDMGNALKAFGREAGFKNLSDAFKGTAEAATDVASKISSIMTPLIAVTGFGSIAAVAGMTERWGSMARQIELTRYQTNISRGAIQTWIGEGKMFGVTVDTMTSTLTGFSDTMQNAVYGRDQGALALFNNLGIDMGKGDLKDPSSKLMETINKLQELRKTAAGAVVAHQVAGKLGLGGIEPMIMAGPEGIQKVLDVLKKYQYVQGDEAVKAGNAFKLSLFAAGTAVDTLSIKISEKLLPETQKMVEGFTRWVSTDAQSWLENIVSKVNSAAQAVGGWNKVLEILATLLLGRVAIGLINMGRIIAGQLLIGLGFVGTKIATLAFELFPAFALGMVEVTTALQVMGAAFIATPIGVWVVGLSAIAGLAYLVYENYNKIATAMGGVYDSALKLVELKNGGSRSDPITPLSAGDRAWNNINSSRYIPSYNSTLSSLFGGQQLGGGTLVTPTQDQTAALIGGQAGRGSGRSQVDVNVNMSNMPQGTQVDVKSPPHINTKTNVHYAVPLSVNP